MSAQYIYSTNQLPKQKLSNLNNSASRQDSVDKKVRKKSQNHLQPPIARLTKKSTSKQNMTVIESGKSRRLSEMSGKRSNRNNSR